MFDLDVQISPGALEQLGLAPQLVFWGGSACAYDPPRYVFEENLVFETVLEEPFHKMQRKHFGLAQSAPGCMTLHLCGEGWLCQQSAADLPLMRFLRALFDADGWVLFWIRDEEEIDALVQVHTPEELTGALCAGMCGRVRQGLLVYKAANPLR